VPCYEDVWGSGGIAPTFLISALDGGEWSASHPGTDSNHGNFTSLSCVLDRLSLCGLMSYPEDEDIVFLINCVNIYETTRRHISEGSNLQIKYGLGSDPFDSSII
jgi:hypothetical protein